MALKVVENIIGPSPKSSILMGVRPSKRPPACPECGNHVATHVTASGKTLLLEYGAWEDGNVIIQDGVAVVLGRDDPRRFDGRLLLMPHFAVCSARLRHTRVKQSA